MKRTRYSLKTLRLTRLIVELKVLLPRDKKISLIKYINYIFALVVGEVKLLLGDQTGH